MEHGIKNILNYLLEHAEKDTSWDNQQYVALKIIKSFKDQGHDLKLVWDGKEVDLDKELEN